jgi:hypothetical protein
MTLQLIVTALLAKLAMFGADRKPELAEQKAEQYASISQAVVTAVEAEKKWPGDKRELAVFAMAWGDHETHYSLDISHGECNPWECDASYKRNGRRISWAMTKQGGPFTVAFAAVSPWQLHEQTCSSPEAWRQARTDINVAAREAVRAIVMMRWSCRSLERGPGDWVRMVYSRLAGRGCAGYFRGIDSRVATYNRLLAASYRVEK